MKKKIVVIGAGIAGLTAAYNLSKDGYDVALLESNSQLGGLGTYFRYKNNWIDKFYHCQMPSDDPLLELIEDVGIKDKMYWKPTRMGFIIDGKRYSFNSPLDLLRFKPISFLQRLRFGVVSLSIRFLGRNKDLDNLPIQEWFQKLYGKVVWNKILKQLFLSKFGDHAGNLPSLYIWQRLGREKNIATRGYIKGGVKTIIDAVEAKINDLGGEIRINTKVIGLRKIDKKVIVTLDDKSSIEADWVVSTVPIPIFANFLKDTNLSQSFTDPKLVYQGVVNAVFFLKKPLDNFYWAPVVNSNTEFDGVVEMTELIEKEQYDNHNAVYVMKYCNRSSDLFKEDENLIAERWKQQLISLYSDLNFTEDDIEDIKIFKTPFVEPIYPLGYSKIKPKMKIKNANIILATSAQVYPNITSWNASCGLATEATNYLNELEQKQNKDPIFYEKVS